MTKMSSAARLRRVQNRIERGAQKLGFTHGLEGFEVTDAGGRTLRMFVASRDPVITHRLTGPKGEQLCLRDG